MSKEKTVHTPGPWRIGNGFIVNKDGWGIVELEGEIQINLDWIEKNPQKHWANGPINIASRNIDTEESVANSQLIAAAPDMLSALREAQEIIKRATGNVSWAVEQAIAKAEGE